MKIFGFNFLTKKSQANAIGRSAKTVREYLEKNYTPEIATNEDAAKKLALRALLEVKHNALKKLHLLSKYFLCEIRMNIIRNTNNLIFTTTS